MRSYTESLFQKMIFHVPMRQDRCLFYKLNSKTHNVMLRTISGDDVHCLLSCPCGSISTLQSYVPTKQLIIFLHGNSDDISTCYAYAQWLADSMNSNVLTVDYPGYGFSTGEDNTSDENMLSAVSAVLKFACENLKHNISSIVIYSKSLGTVPGIHLASLSEMKDLGGLVLISPLASGVRCFLSSSLIPQQILNYLDRCFAPSIERISNVHCPIFIIHGTVDKVVPLANAHALISAAPLGSYYDPLFLQGGHNDMEAIFKNLFITSVQSFCKFCDDKQQSSCPYDD